MMIEAVDVLKLMDRESLVQIEDEVQEREPMPVWEALWEMEQLDEGYMAIVTKIEAVDKMVKLSIKLVETE
jgi:hypothetical protein